jgi:hypothetical protein
VILVQRHPVRFLLALAVVAGALATAALPTRAQVVPALVPRSGGDVHAYRGLGTWVDIFDASYKHPGDAVRSMAAKGVRTLYLETSNYRHRPSFVYKSKVKQFLDAAARWGVRTVAWYLPSFRRIRADFRRSMAAVRLVTDKGNRFDSFALDIESPEVRDASVRSRRMLKLSSRIRSAVGGAYSLGAIIPSPYGIEHAGGYWPHFPYAQLTSYYDVILPMSYSTWKVSGLRRTQWYTEQNVKLIRRETGTDTFPIHIIGGIANKASVNDTRGFVRAVRERGVLGASFYTFPLTRGKQWRVLRHIPANPVEEPTLPANLATFTGDLGNIPGDDQSHPKEVFYTIGGKAGAWNLHFDAYDVQRGEVDVMVNWRPLGHLAAGGRDEWTGPRTRRIPDRYLSRRGTNIIAFVARGNFPKWSTWGVRAVGITRIASATAIRPSGASPTPPRSTSAPPGSSSDTPSSSAAPSAARSDTSSGEETGSHSSPRDAPVPAPSPSPSARG